MIVIQEKIEIRPQPGPQSQFLKTSADIAIYGGAAGGGKSFALLLEPLRHYKNGKFGCVIFRRNTVQVRNEGGLWHESINIYQMLNGHPKEAILEWHFPSGMRVKFSHLENEKTKFDWQGSQIPLIGFDELTHFTEGQFWYMFSRNRSASGVSGYIRATCNPDVDSWVRSLIDWWIGLDGYPIQERSGVLRWFIRVNDEIIWGDSKQELIDKFGPQEIPKSLTFISAKLTDNKILMEKDPSYAANLRALPRIERLRLEGGNWNVRPTAGMYFQREWFEIIDALPANSISRIRSWDKAATKPNENNKDPDWTRGVRMHRYANGLFVIDSLVSTRDTPLKVEQLIKNTATQDGYEIPIGIEEEPGSSGKADAQNFVRLLAGFIVRVEKPTGDKLTRALPLSAQAEQGNIKLVRGDWNDDFLKEMENFTGIDGEGHDDIIDCCSAAFNSLSRRVSTLDVL